jgi:hypothetical protein
LKSTRENQLPGGPKKVSIFDPYSIVIRVKYWHFLWSTRYFVVRSPCLLHAGQNFTFGEYNFERVSFCNHLGKFVTETNDVTPAVRERILKGNWCLFELHNIFQSRRYCKYKSSKIQNSTSPICNIWPENLHEEEQTSSHFI